MEDTNYSKLPSAPAEASATTLARDGFHLGAVRGALGLSGILNL